MTGQLALFDEPEPLYVVIASYRGPRGDIDPPEHVETRANLPRRALREFVPPVEVAEWISSGVERRTSRTSVGWHYRVETQAERWGYDPVDHRWGPISEILPCRWDIARCAYVRCSPRHRHVETIGDYRRVSVYGRRPL